MEMLRGLLADEFELKAHTENREVTVYVITVAGAKPKMTQADGSARMSCKPDPAAIKPVPGLGRMVNCRNLTMEEFAENLEQATGFFDHPIVDGKRRRRVARSAMLRILSAFHLTTRLKKSWD